jgi:hypothetical protein
MPLPPNPATELLKLVFLGKPERMTGLRGKPLVIELTPTDRWPSEHDRLDKIERGAAELFETPEPWPIHIMAVAITAHFCQLVLRCKDDPAMVERVRALLNLASPAVTIQFAEAFLHYLDADRPNLAA